MKILHANRAYLVQQITFSERIYAWLLDEKPI